MTAPVVVTGGTGFIGSRIVERLAAQGAEVVAISTSGRWRWGTPPRARFVAADLAAPASDRALRDALAGARAVVHAAGALYRPSAPARTYRCAHVEATRRLLDALAEAPEGGSTVRLVHVSTTGVLGPTGEEPEDELAVPAPATEYERTKFEGECLALAGRRPGLEVGVARPGLVYGPRSLHLLPFFRAVVSGRFRAIGRRRVVWQPVHVDDVARGIVAMTSASGVDGETFHLAGAERVTVIDLAARIADAAGATPPRGSIPYPLAFAAGALLEAVHAPLGSDPPLSRSRVRTMTESRVYAIDRARERLGIVPEIDLTRGLAEVVAWYRSQGLLP